MTAEKRKSRVGYSGACLQSRGWEMEAGVLEVRLSPQAVLMATNPIFLSRYLKYFLRESTVSVSRDVYFLKVLAAESNTTRGAHTT